MSIKNQISNIKNKRERTLALAVFVMLGIVALQIPISKLAGSSVKFTMFDLFAPASGAFLGTGFGVVAVLLMQIVNLAFHGFANADKGTIIRLFPILFGVLFFARSVKKDSVWLLLIPTFAIISWNLNPIGRSVWFYSLFWTIPVLVYPAVKKSLIARSLASTFTAHSVGGAVWIWAFNLPAAVWVGLIPVVALERLLMTVGISASYIFMNNAVGYLAKRVAFFKNLSLDKKYILKF